mgnify:CR=1 FL=1
MHEALSTNQIIQAVQELFEVEVSRHWVADFEKRHKDELTKKKAKLLTSQRGAQSIPGDVAKFIAQVQTVSDIHPMSAENVVNYDETRVFVQTGGHYVYERVTKERAQKKGRKGINIGSLITFVAASGKILMEVWIFKGKPQKDDEESGVLTAQFNVQASNLSNRITRQKHPIYFAYTATSFNNKELHAHIMDQFGKLWMERGDNKHCWLFGDQLGCHKQADVVMKALGQNVMCWLLPANCSHFLQPLDDKIFANFKGKVSSKAKELTQAHLFSSEDYSKLLHLAAYEAVEDAFTERVVKRAFANTGIWPFDPARIMDLAKHNAGLKKQKTKGKYLGAMKRIAEGVITPQKQKPKQIKQGKVKIQANTTFSPWQLIEKENEAKQQQIVKVEMKKAAASQKAIDKQTERAQRTCAAAGCDIVSQKQGGTKQWKKCPTCSKIFCKMHHAEFNAHVSGCMQTASI